MRSATSRTCRLVASGMEWARPLKTKETVVGDTPAASATSRMRTRGLVMKASPFFLCYPLSKRRCGWLVSADKHLPVRSASAPRCPQPSHSLPRNEPSYPRPTCRNRPFGTTASTFCPPPSSPIPRLLNHPDCSWCLADDTAPSFLPKGFRCGEAGERLRHLQ